MLCSSICAQAGQDAQDLPLPVRLILSEINPMLQENEYQRALETLKAFQARGGTAPEPGLLDPKGYHHPEIYFTMGNCHLLQNRYEQAAAAYRRALEGDPTHTRAWLNLANACYEMEQYAETGRSFEKAYETAKEKNPEHLYFSAAAFLMAGDHLRSLGVFERLFESHPAAIKPEWKENMVHALLAADQSRQALPYIRELALTYSGDKQVQWQEILLHQYVQLDMRREALDFALELTGQAPWIAKWWKALTHIELNAGRYEEALAAMIVYSFLTPMSLEEKRLLADLSLQMGIPVKAVPVYETCLKEKPDKQMLRRLVLAYQQLSRPRTALERINAFDLNQPDTELMLLKGELLYSLNRFEEAAEVYRRAALGKGHNAGRAWLMAGYASWQTHDLEGSRDAFLRAAEYKDQKKAAKSALRQLREVIDQ